MSKNKIKKGKNEKISTLDEDHKKICEDLANISIIIKQNKKKISKLEEDLNQLNKNLNKLVKNDNKTKKEIKKYNDILSEINKIKIEIETLKKFNEINDNDSNILDYFSKNSAILVNYYNCKNNPNNQDNTSYTYDTTSNVPIDIPSDNKTNTKTNKNIKVSNSENIFDSLMGFAKKRKSESLDKSKEIVGKNKKKSCITENDVAFDKKKKEINCPKTLHYMYKVLQDSYYDVSLLKFDKNKFCSVCKTENMTLSIADGSYICKDCGLVVNTIIDSDRPNYKDHIPDSAGNAYKKINHFKEQLNQLQARETTHISDDILNLCKKECKRLNIDLKHLNVKLMRKILKKIGHEKKYEHVFYIINKLNGLDPPILKREQEDKMCQMFIQTLNPFEKYKEKDRHNHLKYGYVIRKLFQLINLDSFMQYYPQLKNKAKLKSHDEVWNKICDELNWEFIPSI